MGFGPGAEPRPEPVATRPAPSPYEQTASPYGTPAEPERVEAMTATAPKPEPSQRRRGAKRQTKAPQAPAQSEPAARPEAAAKTNAAKTNVAWIESLPDDPLRRAILYSEILGPPRALRPFGQRPLDRA